MQRVWDTVGSKVVLYSDNYTYKISLNAQTLSDPASLLKPETLWGSAAQNDTSLTRGPP